VRRHRNQRSSYQLDTSLSSPSNNKSPRRETGGTSFAPFAGNEYVGEPVHSHSYTALPNPAVTVSNENRSRKSRPGNYGPLGSHGSSISVLPNSARQRTPDGHSSPPTSSIPLRTTHRSSSSSHLSASSPTVSTSVNPPPLTLATWESTVSPVPPPPAPVHEVFVVHHDAGAPPPVTVYAAPGSRVTELPPGYNFGSRSPGGAAQQSEFALVGEHLSPTTPSFSRRDQKASYSPRSAPAPSTTFPSPLSPTSPTNSAPDERTLATGPTRLLPSTPNMRSIPITQTPPPDPPPSITSRTRGPRPMSPPW
jgi:hypothetical protein